MNSNRPLVIAVFGLLLLWMVLLIILVTEEKRLETALGRQQGLAIEEGAALYEQNCRTCHGLKGEGVGQLGPALASADFFSKRLGEVGYQHTLRSYILTTTSHGRMMGTRPFYAGNGKTMVMVPWHQDYGGPLRTDQIRSIATFILNWEKTALGEIELKRLVLPARDSSDPQQLARGEEVFAASCTSCHSYGKIIAKEMIGPDLSAIAGEAATRVADLDAASYLRQSVLIPAQFIVEGYQQEALENPCGAVLKETELNAVISFLMQP